MKNAGKIRRRGKKYENKNRANWTHPEHEIRANFIYKCGFFIHTSAIDSPSVQILIILFARRGKRLLYVHVLFGSLTIQFNLKFYFNVEFYIRSNHINALSSKEPYRRIELAINLDASNETFIFHGRLVPRVCAISFLKQNKNKIEKWKEKRH